MLRLKILLQYNIIYYILIILSLSLALFRIYVIKYESKYNINDNNITGIITNIKIKEDYYTLTIKGKEKIIAYYNENIDLSLGDRVLLKGQLYYPTNNTIPNTFNYKKYLNNHDIYFMMKASEIKVINKNNNIFYTIKEKIFNKISKYKKSSDSLKAFVIGDTSSLDEETYYNYQKNGVIHLFSIGSTQINLITAIIFFSLKKINIKKIYKYLIIIIILITIIFTINYSASVIRSLLFFIIYSINKNNDFNISTKNILFLVVSILMLYNPKIIFDIGFQYSSIASYGLIISKRKIKTNYVKSLFFTSIIATLFCMPVTLMNNYEISLISPLNNLIFVPLITLVVFPLSILTIIFEFLEPIYYLTITFMEQINNILGKLTIFNIIIPKINTLFYLIYYFLLIIYVYSKNKLYLTLSILLILSFKLKPKLDLNAYIYYIDVKQGDSTLIYNRNKTILIDTGGVYNYHISKNTITFIKSLGISRIDILILTHGDYDHMGEAINLVENFKVEKVIFNCGEFNELEKELIKVLDKKKIPYYSCIKELNIDDNKLYFLNNNDYGNENDNSSVIYTELNNHKFSFMGDASIEVEEDLIEKYNLKNIEVLKVGHHGSRTSSSKSFIDEVNPKYSIISVGKNNRYGHPNKEVLNNLENSKIYRTDQDGSITFKIRNNKLRIETCSP